LDLSIGTKLQKYAFIRPRLYDPAETIGSLLLGYIGYAYYARIDDDSELGDAAGSLFRYLPYVDSNNYYQRADFFAVDIDLNRKQMIKPKFDDIKLIASQTQTVLFLFVSGNKVKLLNC